MLVRLSIGVALLLGGAAALSVSTGLGLTGGALSIFSGGGELRGTWTYIVPRGYVGPLVIRYRCPGGHPFAPHGRIVTRFSMRGVDCVRDDFPGWSGTEVARRSDGTAMTVVAGLDEMPRSGDIFFGGGVETLGGRTVDNPGKDDFVFSTYYAGPVFCAVGVIAGKPTPARCHNVDATVFAGRAFGYAFCPEDGPMERLDACLRTRTRHR